MLVRVAGVNICPKKSETVSPNMGYSATVFPAQPVDLKTVISKFLNSLKSMCFNSFMNNELKETIVLDREYMSSSTAKAGSCLAKENQEHC